jgi:hypothetical protein
VVKIQKDQTQSSLKTNKARSVSENPESSLMEFQFMGEVVTSVHGHDEA